MSFDSEPDLEHIQSLAKRLQNDWHQQRILDDAMLGYVMLKNTQDVAKTGDKAVKGFRSGIGGIINKQDSAVLQVTPDIHFNPPTENEDDKNHASELENWSAGAWKFSQQGGNVWNRLPMDLRTFGRIWSNVCPNPRLWAGKEYQDMVKRLAGATDQAQIDEIRKEIRDYKRDRWPIRWRYVSPRSTWTTFSGDIWLPEVVELRKMKLDAVKTEFGDSAVPAAFEKSPGNVELEVIEWANHYWCATVIGGGNSAGKIARQYEHGLGCSPYAMREMELLPENEQGLRWAGGLFYAQSMIDTFDEIMADLRENHRDNTRTPLLIKYDPKEYNEDTKVAGRPAHIELKPGSQHSMWTTEEVELAPVPQINAQTIELLREVKDLIYTTQIRPVQQGEAKSGTSQNQYVTQVQIAERAFDPSMRALQDHAEDVVKRMMRCVSSLSAQYPDDPDKVAVFVEKGLIEVGPKDVKGWENACQARAQRAIPIDRNLVINQAMGLKNLGVADETWLEDPLGYENPQQEKRKSYRAAMREAMFQEVILPAAVKWAQGKSLEPTPAELSQIQQQMPFTSPGLQMAISQMLPGAVPPEMAAGMAMNGGQPGAVPGNVLQGMANQRRTGVPQVPHVPQGTGAPTGGY